MNDQVMVNAAEQATVAAYEEFGSALLRYARQLAGSDDAARDAVQEVFLRYFVERRYGRAIETPRAWLYQVLRNYLLDRVKSAPALREVHPADLESLAGWHQENPERLVERRETAREIAAELSGREFTCLTLRCAGLSYAEIAQVMEIRIGTVGAMLSRVEGKLRCYGDRDRKNGFRGLADALLCLVEKELGYSTS